MTMKRALVAAALASLASCSCETRTNTRFPTIEVLDAMGNDRTLVEFGQVQVNVSATQGLRVRNAGNAPLTLSKLEFSKGIFGTSTAIPAVIDVNQELELALTFTPTVPDLRETGSVTISSDDPAKPTVTVQLAGLGVTAVAVVAPTSIAFGEVYVGESKTATVTLTNTGSNDLTVTTARFSAATPSSVSADLSTLQRTLHASETATATITFGPSTADVLAGALEIVLPGALGIKSVPLTGQGIQAVPRLCVKLDDSPFEQCTDPANVFLQVPLGSHCDARVYPPDGGPSPCVGLDGGRAPYSRGLQFYFRNEGNTPVTYALGFQAQLGAVCDAGSTVDFEFANAPAAGDGGTRVSWVEGDRQVPAMVSDPKPWETPGVAVTYRARSGCREDAADQARISWTRKEPIGAPTRRPTTYLVNLTGQSLLPHGVADPINISGTPPTSAEFVGAANAGDGPLTITAVSVWATETLADGGHGDAPFAPCGPGVGDCAFFGWTTDGGDPSLTLPHTLAGTPVVGNPTREALGRIEFHVAPDGGSPQLGREYRIFVVLDTNDPYQPQVATRVRAVAQ